MYGPAKFYGTALFIVLLALVFIVLNARQDAANKRSKCEAQDGYYIMHNYFGICFNNSAIKYTD